MAVSVSSLTRFITLVQETKTLRGINTCRIAPTYMEEFQGCILDGMQTELIDLPHITEDIMESYPEKCVQVCVSGDQYKSESTLLENFTKKGLQDTLAQC